MSGRDKRLWWLPRPFVWGLAAYVGVTPTDVVEALRAGSQEESRQYYNVRSGLSSLVAIPLMLSAVALEATHLDDRVVRTILRMPNAPGILVIVPAIIGVAFAGYYAQRRINWERREQRAAHSDRSSHAVPKHGGPVEKTKFWSPQRKAAALMAIAILLATVNRHFGH